MRIVLALLILGAIAFAAPTTAVTVSPVSAAVYNCGGVDVPDTVFNIAGAGTVNTTNWVANGCGIGRGM
jgi:hypothetical protein